MMMTKTLGIILTLLIASVTGLFAQDLFQEESTERVIRTQPVVTSTATTEINTTNDSKNNKSTMKDANSLDPRYFSIGLESLLTRGDVQVYYEIPKKDADVVWMFMGHINPHAQHQVETGKFGLYVGARAYLEKNQEGPFAQLLGGFNYEASDTIKPSALLGVGYKYQIKEKLFTEAGLYFSRSYESSRGSDAYALLTLGLELDYRIPFL